MNVVDDWFRGTAQKKMEEILLDRESHIYSYLRSSAVKQIFEEHRSGQNDNHKILFSLIVFEEWLRAHGEPASTLI